MINYYIILVTLLFCTNTKKIKQENKLDKIYIYTDFYKAGSTTLLKNVFDSPNLYGVEKKFINVDKKEMDMFSFIIQNSGINKLNQMKINVDLALIATIEGQEHFFVISISRSVIIDLTSNLIYKLNREELLDKANIFVQKYN